MNTFLFIVIEAVVNLLIEELTVVLGLVFVFVVLTVLFLFVFALLFSDANIHLENISLNTSIF